MPKKENSLVQLNEFLQSLPKHFQVLETPVDVDVQLAYYQQARTQEKPGTPPDGKQLEQYEETLRSGQTDTEEKKRLLITLASVGTPEAYRIIERYAAKPDEGLEAWSIMALHESKMVLESSLLDENQVYISTGLGGKDDMLRYFAVILHKQAPLEDFQKKVLDGEVRDAVNAAEGVTERIAHYGGFSTVQLLIPVRNDLTHVLISAIQESNAYGDFLETDMLITNMKILSNKEIMQLIAQKNG
ncbi:MAG: hypothetical protein IJS25_07200 [Bacteroidales bacterium]|nr:hypothetical protein [Bacteroidales bacterium]